MFSKPSSNPQQTPATPATPAAPAPAPVAAAPEPPRAAQQRPRGGSLIAADMVLEGDISGGGEIQIEGTVKGDVRVEHVTVGDGGQVEGGIHAEAVEVRGKVTGSITAKQVRLYGACHVDGDITHEQLAMETGAFFQGRSLRLQRPHAPATVTAPAPRVSAEITQPPREPSLSAKSAPAAQA